MLLILKGGYVKYFLLIFVIAFVSCTDNGDPKEKLTEIKEEVKTEIKSNSKKNRNEEVVKEIMTLNENEILVAHVKTNMGDFDIQLFADKAPKTVENFVGLISQNYYDSVSFHRVIDDFMIQGGDPTGTGSGGNSYFGGNFEDEFHPELRHSDPGILSMANAGPNTNGSQFFITLVPTPWLDGKHSIFGMVINGMDVVEKIGKVETSKPFDKPVKDVIMEKVTVEKISR